MIKVKSCSMRSRAIYLLAFPIIVSDPIAAKQNAYTNKNCPVTFVVPSHLELRDVVGWTDPSDKIACRISVVRKNRTKTLPLEKSFDDVRDLSDVGLDVKYIPIKSRLTELNFTFLDGHVSYKGETLSSNAKTMGYAILQTRPMEYHPVGNGDMYVGIQDLIERGSTKVSSNRSVSYVFLVGNKKYSIDVKITYDKDRFNNKIKQNSILRLLKSANFDFEEENTKNFKLRG
jgi:prepilin-type processing-associated H-X9-DG protein